MAVFIQDSLLDQAPCGFVSFADDGTILGVNKTILDLLGYRRVEVEGAHLQKILPPGARVFYNTHIFPMLRMHGKVDEISLPLLTKDGDTLPMLLNAVRREREDRVVNDCIFVRMIERSRYEVQLLEARREAERASDAKARFLSMMSHDLRTPLTTITGHADLLVNGVYGALDEEAQDSVETISTAARELSRMMDDILSFAQLQSETVRVHTTTVPMSGAIARAESLIRMRVAQAGLVFEHSGCDEVAVCADPDRLQQILLNLLTNAIKFTPPGGSLTLSCERSADRVLIRVADTGIGIPPDQIERIFDAFVQLGTDPAQPANRGVGLGLAISRDLARALGGELTASSTPGQGSVFTLDLPVAASAPVT